MRPKKRVVKLVGKVENSLPIAARPKARPKQLPKILIIDIETAPIQALVWKIWEENVGIDSIQHDSSIISFGAKWLGDPKMIYMDVGGRGVDQVRDDRMLMQPLWDLLNETDVLVAQNGQAFDTKRINARLIKHGFGPYSPIRQVDTLLTSKRLFKFTSNKLEWVAAQLTDTKKSKHHKFPGIQLWLECLKDNASAWQEMKRYNLQDVIACEKVYLRQLAWNDRHPNVGTYDWSLLTMCPRCGAPDKLEAEGYRTLQTGVYAQYRCGACGAWSRGKKLMTDKETRAVKLAA